jgi:uncharacterized membrane protein YeaQ/YmgE (transglycosylase-associated protein family)
MDLLTWVFIGMIIGVVATGWQTRLSFKKLILSVAIGLIGSVSGGVVGYILYDASLNGFSISVFSTSLIITLLVIISRRKIKQLIAVYRLHHPKILMLSDGKVNFPRTDSLIVGSHSLA